MKTRDVIFLRKKDRKKIGLPKWFLEGAFDAEIAFLKDEDFYGIRLPIEWLLNSIPYFFAADCNIEE
jgi:hypothetical protein